MTIINTPDAQAVRILDSATYATVAVSTASGNRLTVIVRPAFVVAVHKDGRVSKGNVTRVVDGRLHIYADGHTHDATLVYRSTEITSVCCWHART